MKQTADYAAFAALDLRVGTVTAVEESRSRKPTWRLTIDFGEEIGSKVSCGAFRNYAPDELLGEQVIAVVNLPPLRMGPELSEVFVLGVDDGEGGAIRLTVESEVAPGSVVS